MSTPPLSYGILLYPGFEVLDMAGPIETLNTLSRMPDQDGFSFKDMTLSFLAKTMNPITPSGGTAFTSVQVYHPTHTFDNAPQLDVLLVPGGLGSVPWNPLLEAVDYIRRAYQGDESHRPLRYLISVCTGAGLLAEAGVLDGLRATTNKMAWDDITPLGPRTHWIARARWVDAGRVWTTSGVSAGTDGVIAWLAKVFHGHPEVMDQVVTSMEYNRVTDSENDPFASVNGCVDVLPQEP